MSLPRKAVRSLDYVGLPLTSALGKAFPWTFGFNNEVKKVDEQRPAHDQKPNSQPHLLIIINSISFFLSHRKEIAQEAISRGWKVTLAAPIAPERETLTQMGVRVLPLPVSRWDIGPLVEWRTFRAIHQLIGSERPDVVHLVTIKPVVYGGLASRCIRGAPAVLSAVPGLGYVFSSNSLRARLLRPLVMVAYRLALGGRRQQVIVQNPDDRQMLLTHQLVRAERVTLIRGSGTDPMEFVMLPEPEGMPLVVLPARLLREKGVMEFVEAARLLHSQGVKARFALVGDGEPSNPSTITPLELEDWQTEGVIEWWGKRSDMPSVLAQSNVVCLPSSYGEGVPKALIEAAACGRAIVTTDAPGCREIVQNGVNGLLVPPNQVLPLAEALRTLIEDGPMRQRMGKEGNRLFEAEFTVDRVVKAHFALYEDLMETKVNYSQ